MALLSAWVNVSLIEGGYRSGAFGNRVEVCQGIVDCGLEAAQEDYIQLRI